MNTLPSQVNVVPPRQVAWVFMFGALLFCGWLGGRELWDPDEPRYARVAAEMAQSGDALHLRLNGEAYREKPPLYFWLVAATAQVRGTSYPGSWAALLPSALSAALCLAAVYWAGYRYFEPRAAWMAAAITGTSALFLWIGRRAQLDTTLTAACTLASLWLYESFLPGRRVGWAMAAGAAMAAAALTKFHGYIPVITAGLFLLYAKRPGRRRAALMLLLATVVALALSAPWFYHAAATGTGPDLFHQAQRVSDWRGHAHGPFYFLAVVPLAFLPWSVYAAELLWDAWLARKTGTDTYLTAGRSDATGTDRRQFPFPGRAPSFAAYCALWAIGVFVLFTIPGSKRELYILPMVPALGLLTARGISRLVDARKARSDWRPMLSGRIVGLAFLLVGYGLVVAGGVCLGLQPARPAWQMAVMGAVVMAAALVILGVGSKATVASVRVVTASMVVILFTSTFTVIPWLSARKSLRPFCDGVLQRMGPHPRVAVFYQGIIGHLLYCLPDVERVQPVDPVLAFEQDGRRVEMEAGEYRSLSRTEAATLRRLPGFAPETYQRIHDFLKAPNSVMIFKNERFGDLPPDVRANLRVVFARTVSNDVYYAVQLAKTRSP